MVRMAKVMQHFKTAASDTSQKYRGREEITLLDGTVRLCENRAVARQYMNFMESLQNGTIKPEECSIKELFESAVEDGRSIVNTWGTRNGGRGGVQLIEAGIDTTAFSEINGQIVYTKIMEAYNMPGLIGNRLFTTIPTGFDGEKIPGVGQLGDGAESIGEGQPYPMVGISAEYIETPQTTKRGFIVPVTKEIIYFDRTGMVMRRASQVGEWLAINKEKRQLDVAFGITNNYKYRGTTINTYGDNSGAHDWDNLAATNALYDWTDIENAELLFDALNDRLTGEPIVLTRNQVVVPSALKMTASRVIGASEIEHVDNQANAVTIRTRSGNPLSNYEIVSSPYVQRRTSSTSTWFYGDFPKAFGYMENWPITVVKAPVNSELEFTNDIVSRTKVSERGVAAVLDPRYVVKCTG